MTERRVRSVARPIYGRPQPMRGRKQGRRFNLGIVPRRFIILAIAVIAVLMFLKSVFGVKTVNVKSTTRSAEIQAEIQKIAGAKWSQHNLLTLSSGALETDLLQADPMIKTASIHRSWPNGLSADIALKAPSLGWSSGNQVYLLDRDGSAIGSLPSASQLPIVVDGSNLPVVLGKRVTSSRFVTFTGELNQALIALKLNPSRYEVKDTTLDLYVTTNKGYQLIVDTSRKASDEVNDLQALLGFLKGKPAPSQYIDLRIAGKAYYK